MRRDLAKRLSSLEKQINANGMQRKVVFLVPTSDGRYLSFLDDPIIYNSIEELKAAFKSYKLHIIFHGRRVAEVYRPDKFEQAKVYKKR